MTGGGIRGHCYILFLWDRSQRLTGGAARTWTITRTTPPATAKKGYKSWVSDK
jgi:hypothetical protein